MPWLIVISDTVVYGAVSVAASAMAVAIRTLYTDGKRERERMQKVISDLTDTLKEALAELRK